MVENHDSMDIEQSASQRMGYKVTPLCLIQQPVGINAIAATRCIKRVYSGGHDGVVRRYDFFASLNGKLKLNPSAQLGLPDTLWRNGVSCGQWTNSGVQRHPLNLMQDDPDDLSQSSGLDHTTRPVMSMALEKEALWVLIGQNDGTISLCTARHDSGTCLHTFKGHQSIVNQLTLTADEQKFLSGSWDSTINFWDLNDGSCTQNYGSDGDAQIVSLQLKPSSSDKQFLCSLADGQSNIYDVRSSKPQMSFNAQSKISPKGDSDPQQSQDHVYMSACWSPDGTRIYCGRRDESIDVWDVRSTRLVHNVKLPSNSGIVSHTLALSDNHHLIVCSHDVIRLCDVNAALSNPDSNGDQSGDIFQIVGGHYGGFISQAFVDPEEKFMVTSSGSRGWHNILDNHQMLFYTIDRCAIQQGDQSLADVDLSSEVDPQQNESKQ
ncbi:hypothetical protein MIR68_008789 [Amoeboaphelidium protococcarum]|nr:hypothetical protein MIR68_008789 [Amoeboaphelidium protococcarum]